MSNKKIIKQLNLTKQRIKEGRNIVREQINDNTLPLIAESGNEKAYLDLKAARQFYNISCRDTNEQIDRVIKMYQPPGPFEKIPKKYTYPKTRQWIAPFFIPTLFVHKSITRKDFDLFANRMAENIYGNVIRGFACCVYEAYFIEKDLLHFPFERGSNEKFDLDEYDEDYWDELYFRIDAFAKRNIFVFIDLVDNCSLYERPNSNWFFHPWNGKNNINGTSEWAGSVYHYMESEHSWKPGVKETGEYVEKFYNEFVKRTWERFAGMIGYSAGNEVWARIEFHKIQQRIIEANAPEIKRDYMITSMGRDNFYGVDIGRDFIYGLHGCCNEAKYNERDLVIPDKTWGEIRAKRYIASQDGCFPTKTAAEAEAFFAKILADGRAGGEQNLRPNSVKVDGIWKSLANKPNKIDWSFQSLEYSYAEAMKRAWFAFNNWPI